jgi:hypothetical protein
LVKPSPSESDGSQFRPPHDIEPRQKVILDSQAEWIAGIAASGTHVAIQASVYGAIGNLRRPVSTTFHLERQSERDQRQGQSAGNNAFQKDILLY